MKNKKIEGRTRRRIEQGVIWIVLVLVTLWKVVRNNLGPWSLKSQSYIICKSQIKFLA